jgi:hypothetical protein
MTRTHYIILVIIAALAIFTGCTAIQRQKLLADAKTILAPGALSLIVDVATQELKYGNVDMLHAASAALNTVVTTRNLETLLNDATNDKVPTLSAVVAESVTSKEQAWAAANAISSVALKK